MTYLIIVYIEFRSLHASNNDNFDLVVLADGGHLGGLNISGGGEFVLLQDGSEAALQGLFLLEKLGSLSEVVDPASEPPLVDPDVPEEDSSVLQDEAEGGLGLSLSLLVSEQVPDSDDAVHAWDEADEDDGVNVHEVSTDFDPSLSGFLEHVLAAEGVDQLWGGEDDVDVPPPVHPVGVVGAGGGQGEGVSGVSPPLVEGAAAASVVSWLLHVIVLLKFNGLGKLN